MNASSSVTSRIDTSRVAVLANTALVLTGSVLALLGTLDLWSGVFVVCIGLIGIYVSILGRTGSTSRTNESRRRGSVVKRLSYASR